MCYLTQAVRLYRHRGRLYLFSFSSKIQPLPFERTGPELQCSGRLISKAVLCWSGGLRLETKHSQVWREDMSTETVSVAYWQTGEVFQSIFLLQPKLKKSRCTFPSVNNGRRVSENNFFLPFSSSPRLEHGGQQRLKPGLRKCECVYCVWYCSGLF